MSALASSLTFQQLVVDGVLSPIHQAFGDTLQRLDPDGDPNVVLAAVLCSEQLSRGHVCLDLPSAHELTFPTPEADLHIRQYNNWPRVSTWIEHLQNSPLVTAIERDAERESPSTPLVLDVERNRLYLARYWFFEQRLAEHIARRLQQADIGFDETRLCIDILQLFPNREGTGSRDQCLAVANSVDRWFSVITGGPGTGKTTTVASLLALRLMQQLAAGNDPAAFRILLMAPTGKAAQRLNESLSRAAGLLEVDPRIRTALEQVTAGTIHRLLGWTPLPPERGGPFRHKAGLPLEADIVLVDEASMVDLALMCRLFDAIPESTQVVLIGDRDQLASVEAGSVLSDLCGSLPGRTWERLSPERRSIIGKRTGWLPAEASREVTDSQSLSAKAGTKKQVATRSRKAHPKQMALPLGDGWNAEPDESNSLTNTLATSVATLNHSHRFSLDSSLGQLAAAIRDGRADDAISLLRDANPEEIQWLSGGSDQAVPLDATVDQAAAGYREYLEQLRSEPTGTLKLLQASSQIRVLCAHRSGPRGEAMLNQRITERLTADALLSPYANDSLGRLVMVSRNDYRLDLFNGDVGVVVKSDDNSGSSAGYGRARAIIMEDPREESGVRRVPASLVPGVQDCFAMTIHRSQGSEFHQVLLVLPEHDSSVLSRELLYTAVTRVKESSDEASGAVRPGLLCIAGSELVIRSAIARSVRRSSGLGDEIDRRSRISTESMQASS
ncbi:MAG: exodeoxyribonuclease V subunit alpha [Planctomycetota bacterium]|nr:exodeoxyribonuclease V subunit alpha [Planctomycetota bacterium]